MFRATIDRIEKDTAVCVLEDGREFVVPLEHMPDDVGEGDVVYVYISKDAEHTRAEQADAKQILNELLQSS